MPGSNFRDGVFSNLLLQPKDWTWYEDRHNHILIDHLLHDLLVVCRQVGKANKSEGATSTYPEVSRGGWCHLFHCVSWNFYFPSVTWNSQSTGRVGISVGVQLDSPEPTYFLTMNTSHDRHQRRPVVDFIHQKAPFLQPFPSNCRGVFILFSQYFSYRQLSGKSHGRFLGLAVDPPSKRG